MIRIPRSFRRSKTNVTSKSSFDSIGLRYGIDQSSGKHDYLKSYESELEAITVPIRNIVLISGQNQDATARAFAEFYNDADVHLISRFDMNSEDGATLPFNVKSMLVAKNINQLHSVLARLPRPEVIIDDGSNRKSEKSSLFKELFYYIPDGGKFIIEDLHASFVPSLNDASGEDVIELINRLMDSKRRQGYADTSLSANDQFLTNAIRSVTNYGKIAFVTKSGRHLFKLRHDEANDILAVHYNSEWGKNLLTIPSTSYETLHKVNTNIEQFDHRFAREIKTPTLNLRQYQWPECGHRQTCIFGDFLLPDTFRHGRARNLSSAALNDVTSRFATVRSSGSSRKLYGEYFYFDTEYPGHFGHVMTEVVAKIWAWEEARKIFPKIRPLLSLPLDRNSIPDFQLRVFESAGISASEIEYIGATESVTVERLISGTPQFSNPYWADRDLARIWSNIADFLVKEPQSKLKKIFVSRVKAGVRSCNNTVEVESKFREHGFDIVFPERLTFQEQIDLFMNAEVIAGFGGSGMFNSMFSRAPGTRIILASENYIAMNEHLISSVLKDEMHYFWCPADKKYPKGTWTAEAFRSNFTFDFTRDGDRLDSLLKSI